MGEGEKRHTRAGLARLGRMAALALLVAVALDLGGVALGSAHTPGMPGSATGAIGGIAHAAATNNAPGTAAQLADTPASETWYFAEGYTGPTFTEWLTLANPNAATANVTVAYYLDNGATPLTKSYSVPSTRRATLDVNAEVGSGHNVSMVVTSTQPIIAERPMYFTFTGMPGHPIASGTDVLGATELGQTFDFGYLDTSTAHTTYLTVLNPQASAMTVTVNYYAAAGGAPLAISHTVAATSRGTIAVNAEAGLAPGSYSAQVSLSMPGLVERPMYFDDTVTGLPGASDVVGVSAPETSWYFAEGYTSPTFSERYILANPDPTSAASATVTFMLTDGSTRTANVTLAPGAQQVVSVNDVLGSDDVNNSATVQATGPILAERLMSFTYTGAVGNAGSSSIPGTSDVLGARAPGTAFAFAEGYTGGAFAEYLTIANPGATTATVQATYLPSIGAPATAQTYTVPPHSRFTKNTAEVMGQAEFSLIITSDQPVVAERPMYFVFSFDGNGPQPGGTDVVGFQGASAPPPADWPTYLANTAHTGFNSDETSLTASNIASLHVKWTAHANGIISSQAIEANNTVYWGSWDGYEHATSAGGTERWDTYIGQTADPLCSETVGVASTATLGTIGTTPVIFVGGGQATFYALNAATGAVIWSSQLGTAPSHFIWSSPTVYNGHVYIGMASMGDCPLVQGQLLELDPTSGAIEHTFDTVPDGCTGASIWGSPTIDATTGLIYFATGNGGDCGSAEPYAVALLAVRASDLSLVSSWTVPPDEQYGDGDFGSTPTLFDALISGTQRHLVGLPNKNGVYYALDRTNLAAGPVWQRQIAVGGSCPECGQGSISSSAFDGTTLYVAGGITTIGSNSCAGSVRALDPATGAVRWHACLSSGAVLAALSALHGIVFVSQGSEFDALNAQSGAALFTFNDPASGSAFLSPSSIANGQLYIGNADGTFSAFGL